MAQIIRNENLFCTCCGGKFKLIYPISMTEMNKKVKHFTALHKDCKQTWTEPQADQSQSITAKAMFWLNNGEHGMSSKTMWNCFMNIQKFTVYHPYDPDDFSRCYKLLETVPEWKIEIKRLKSLSKEWSNLVDNWTKLTELYEDMVINHKDNGMYDLMQKCIS
jgi:hypothetical protein